MRISLINPNNPTNAANVPFLQKSLLSWNAKAYSPPLNLCMVAAYTPKDIEVSLTDECVKPIDLDEKADLVALTAYTNNAPRAYEIAKSFRERGVTVVIGGIHASSVPGEALAHCDAVIIGEAEGTWQRLIEDYSRGCLQRTYKNERLVNLSNLPIPRRDLLNPHDYVTTNTVQTARGCPKNCSFCSVTRFNGRTYRFRPIGDVIAELKDLPSRSVFFVDDNIYSHRERTKELFTAMMPLGLRWGSQCTISIAHDSEMLELAVASGCIGLAIGLESFSKESLKGAHKRFNNPELFHEEIDTIKRHGILIWGSFVLGFDEDNKKNLEKTIFLAKRSKLDFACFNFLTPLPGTQVYKQFHREGRLSGKSWNDYNMSHLVFKPLSVTSKTLEKMVRKAWLDFYSPAAIFHRLSFSLSKTRFFIWVINFALFFYTRKKLIWEWKEN